MKLLLVLIAAGSLLFGQAPTPKKTTPKTEAKKKAPKDDYDPDKLPPGEIACGRLGSKSAPPCQCMKHRIQIQDDAIAKCDEINDRKERLTCLGKVPACPDVRDAEGIHYNDLGQPMAAQCKRSCRLARCECCHS